MKPRPTILNIFSALLLIGAIIFIIFFSQDYQIPLAVEITIIALGGLLLDFILRYIINKISPSNKRLVVNILGTIVIIIAYFLHRNHSKDLKILISDQVDIIAIAYGVPGTSALPINYLTLNSTIALPTDGIIFTSSPMRNSDIPHTRFIKNDGTEIFIEDLWNNRYSDKIEIDCHGTIVSVRIIHLGKENGLEKINKKHNEVERKLHKLCSDLVIK